MTMDQIDLHPTNFGHLNCEYARAREAIDQELHCRTEKRKAKLAVIGLLGGQIHHPNSPKLRKFVQFPDNTKAVF